MEAKLEKLYEIVNWIIINSSRMDVNVISKWDNKLGIKMKTKNCIVKRKGHEEEFDEKKVYGSTYAACLNTQLKHTESEKIAAKVAKEIKAWTKTKKTVNSTQIFKQTISVIKKHNKDAAFMYETHRDIS